MYLVKKFTQILELTTSQKLKAAERRERKAMSGLAKAKRRLDKSTYEYSTTQAGVLILLSKLDIIQLHLATKRAVSAGKSAKLDKLILDIHTE
jgi:hypothetical protein